MAKPVRMMTETFQSIGHCLTPSKHNLEDFPSFCGSICRAAGRLAALCDGAAAAAIARYCRAKFRPNCGVGRYYLALAPARNAAGGAT
jgi:hypothetical protein